MPARLGSGVSPVLRNQEQPLGEQAEFTGPVTATVEVMSVPPSVLDAFGTSAPASRLRGGEETTYRSGDVVLKPAARADEAVEGVQRGIDGFDDAVQSFGGNEGDEGGEEENTGNEGNWTAP